MTMPPDQQSAGYTQPWVVPPGACVTLHANLPQVTRVDVVRIACANAEASPDGQQHGPAQRLVAVSGADCGEHGPALAGLQAGAQVHVNCGELPAWAGLGLLFAVQRRPRGRPGAVLSLMGSDGLSLQVDIGMNASNQPCLRLGLTGTVTMPDLPLPDHEWLLLNLAFTPAGLKLRTAICRANLPGGLPQTWQNAALVACTMPKGSPGQIHLGTRADGTTSADFRIDLVSVLHQSAIDGLSPGQLLASDGMTAAPWECRPNAQSCLLRARSGTGASLVDTSGQASLTEIQRPYNAVRGIRWDGRSHDPANAPAHYTALHFCSDQMLNAHWSPTVSWQVPADLPSGSYAFRLQPADHGEPVYASFFVSAAGHPRHRLAVLMPTFSYLAYANAVPDMRGPVVSPAAHPAEQHLDALHPAHGRSLYERHPDGFGVLWSSSRRPLWSISPGHRPWQLVADTWLLDWLDRIGQPFDVITDHDLHRLGASALAPYTVVLSGHHPEYTSTAMWDGLWQYLVDGGRLMYLGGNGWYWRTAVDPTADMIEVRRAEDGTRPHLAQAGESHCAFTGEYGGLWRRLGRPPQHLVGVGMAAQGFDRATHFAKGPDANAAEVAFVFRGIEGEHWGRSGWWGGGASGWEIDRQDPDLGTPAGTWWLGRSEGHAASMLRTKEELLSNALPMADAKARSDMVLAPVGQGDVFAVGSMTWIGSLHGTGTEPTDVATITANVLQRFLDPKPLPRKPARSS